MINSLSNETLATTLVLLDLTSIIAVFNKTDDYCSQATCIVTGVVWLGYQDSQWQYTRTHATINNDASTTHDYLQIGMLYNL